ncbi:MAG TPA: TolC family protein [Gemmataceae bacterium]|nr:TolC family protein [Gemmataceae bacterium]
MRSLGIISVLVVAIGCRAYPIAPPPLPQARAKVTASAPNTSDIIPCAAMVPAEADDSPREQEPQPILPSPTKIETPDAVAAMAGQQHPLTLADLEQMALSNNPTIPQAGALVQQEQGLARQAGLYPNPQAGYLRTDADQSGQSQTAGVFLSQEFVTAGKLRLAQQALGQDVQLRRWQLTAQQTRVLNDLRIRYYEVLGAQQAVQSAKDLVKLAEDGVRVAERLLEAKQGARPDVLQAKIQLSAIRTSLQDAQYRHRSAWQHLANVTGTDLPPASLAGNLEGDIPVLEWQESLQRLLASSPLLKTQEAEIRASQYEVKLARAQAIPNVNVQVVAQRDHIMKYSSVSTLIAMPVPIFNRNQGNIQNARGVLQQQQKEYERIRLALSDQLAASFRQYQTLRAQADRLEKEILPLAKENLDLTTQAYKAGRFDILRVLNARQSYFQANLAHIDALTELHKVVVEIQGLQLTGGLNPTEVGTALQTTPGSTTGIRGVLLQQLQEKRGGASQNLPGAIQGAER